MERLFTNSEAAAVLRISTHTLRAWLCQGRVRPVKLGRRTVFTERELQRIIDVGKRKGRRPHVGSPPGCSQMCPE